jgi:hypothetical protein
MELMELRILVSDRNDADIDRALRSLGSIRNLAVNIVTSGQIIPTNVPLPVAIFNGESRVHEYGKDAVLKLVDDLRTGFLK